jgi:hypothetical protein
MEFSFANPWGFLALLGIPAILIAHILQRRKKRVPVSTLFLIEQLAAQSIAGRRWERLRQSIPLWLQLLAMLLLALLLAGPRWLRSESVQNVVVILDSTWSMSAYRDEIMGRLRGTLNSIAGQTTKTDWVLMESDLKRGQLYAGRDLEGVLRALEDWHPNLPGHDFNPSWRLGAGLLQGQGDLLFVTDHAVEPPPGVTVLALGEPVANVGFIGFRTENAPAAAAPAPAAPAPPQPGNSSVAVPVAGAPRLQWVALVRNYWDQPQTRSWHLQSGNSKGPDQQIQLAGGEVRVLRGEFPEGVTAAELVLTGDRFTADDRLPFVRPEAKPLKIAVSAGLPDEHRTFWAKLIGNVPAAEINVGATPGPVVYADPKLDITKDVSNAVNNNGNAATPAAPEADITIAAYNPLNPNLANRTGIVLVAEPGKPKEYRKGLVFSEAHPLVEDLNWQSLLAYRTFGIPMQDSDEPLVWQDNQPLIYLRAVPKGEPQLLVSIDPRQSNLGRLPAFAVLTLRYMESVRRGKLALEVANVDANQLLEIATDPDRKETIYVRSIADGPAAPETFREYFEDQVSVLRAPGTPSFFEVRQNETVLFRGAAQFADSAEADLTQAGRTDAWDGLESRVIEVNREEESLTPLWLLALCGVLLIGWKAASRQ